MPGMWFAYICSQSVVCPSILIVISMIDISILIGINLSVFPFMDYAFGVQSKNFAIL